MLDVSAQLGVLLQGLAAVLSLALLVTCCVHVKEIQVSYCKTQYKIKHSKNNTENTLTLKVPSRCVKPRCVDLVAGSSSELGTFGTGDSRLKF